MEASLGSHSADEHHAAEANASIDAQQGVKEEKLPILSAYLEENIEELALKFSSALPFRHVLIEPFFDDALCDSLIREFPKPDQAGMLNEFGKPNRKFARHDVRNISPVYRELDDFVQSDKFLKIMEKLTGIPNLLYDPEYHGAGTHDNMSGQGMDAHIDFNLHRTTGYHRRINAIIYLNEEWDEAWGGVLELHKDPWDLRNDEVIGFAPLKNRCVLFETNEYSWHGFKPVKTPPGKEVSRKSFTIYMYTRERPKEETAEKHATIYVQDGLSDHFEPGHVLTQSDIDDLLRNFSRRNEYLRALYGRERSFQTTIANLRAFSNSFRLPALGFGRQKQPVEGVYPGLGVTPSMSAEWVAVNPIRRIVITGRLPPYIPRNVLTVRIGDGTIETFPVADRFRLEIKCDFKPQEIISLSVLAEVSSSPKEAGVGTDARPFSWLFQEIHLLS